MKKIISYMCLLVITLTGCGSDALQQEMLSVQASNNSIKITSSAQANNVKRNDITWGELDQLNTYKDIRRVWEDKLHIVKFDNSSKNGVLFINLDGAWSGNSTLYNAFQNKVFIEKYWGDGQIKSALAKAAINQFSDISNETTGIYASVNAYYNILPTNVDGTSGLTDIISRAEAMSAIYRGDTPAIFLEENEEFRQVVGDSVYNKYAFGVTENSYLDYKNGSLCYDTYNSAITRAEVIYMLVQRYYKEEYDSTATSGNEFTDCKNAGDIAVNLGFKDGYAWQSYELDYCLQTDVGCPESLYKALVVAKNHGIISSETKWNQPLMGGTLLGYMISTYNSIYKARGFAINAKLGENVGESLVEIIETEVVEPEITEEVVDSVVVSQVRNVVDIDDLLRIYGDEIDMTEEELAEAYRVAEEWTFDAADQWMEVAHCSWLNVRTGPSTDYSIISSVPSGTKCHIVAVCRENGWYRIIANKKIVYQCGVYFQDFEGSEDYLIRTGDNANN